MPSILINSPIPSHAKHPHTMMLPPLCLTVFCRLHSFSCSPSFRHTLTRHFCPNNSNLLSSLQMIHFQKSIVIPAYFFAKSNLFFLFLVLINGRCTTIRLTSPASRSLRWIVCAEMYKFKDSLICRHVFLGSFRF